MSIRKPFLAVAVFAIIIIAAFFILPQTAMAAVSQVLIGTADVMQASHGVIGADWNAGTLTLAAGSYGPILIYCDSGDTVYLVVNGVVDVTGDTSNNGQAIACSGSLIINGSGSLTATGANVTDSYMGNGGSGIAVAVDVTINASTTAKGGWGESGGDSGKGVHGISAIGDVTINAQTTATGGKGVSQINSYGYFGQGGLGIVAHYGSVTITGGVVDATGGDGSATVDGDGLGGHGIRAGSGSVTISGGTVTANGGVGTGAGSCSGTGGDGIVAMGDVTINTPTTAMGGAGNTTGYGGSYGGNSIMISSGSVVFNDAAAKLTAKDGTPLNTGTFTATKDSAVSAYNWNVDSATPAGADALTLTVNRNTTQYVIKLDEVAPEIVASLPDGTVGTAYSQSLLVKGTPANWTLENGTTLPPGLTHDVNTGVISGMPTTAGTYIFEIKASNSVGNDTEALTITINPAPTYPSSGGSGAPQPPAAPKATAASFPAGGQVVGSRITVYKYEALKTTLFRLNKGEAFNVLGLANGGRALLIEKDGREGYVALKDIGFTLETPIKATALKKAAAYTKLTSGKLKRIGYYDKNQVLHIYGISGKYLINKQANATYYLDAGQWKLSLAQ